MALLLMAKATTTKAHRKVSTAAKVVSTIASRHIQADKAMAASSTAKDSMMVQAMAETKVTFKGHLRANMAAKVDMADHNKVNTRPTRQATSPTHLHQIREDMEANKEVTTSILHLPTAKARATILLHQTKPTAVPSNKGDMADSKAATVARIKAAMEVSRVVMAVATLLSPAGRQASTIFICA